MTKPATPSPTSSRNANGPDRRATVTMDTGPRELPTAGMVGPFWIVERSGQPAVLAVPIPLAQAVSYGDMLTVETGHADYWAHLARRGAADLQASGLPTVPVWSEYDEWPRGRVLYDSIQRCFVVRADRQLHRPRFLALIADRFQIVIKEARVLRDEHYQSVRRVPLLPL